MCIYSPNIHVYTCRVFFFFFTLPRNNPMDVLVFSLRLLTGPPMTGITAAFRLSEIVPARARKSLRSDDVFVSTTTDIRKIMRRSLLGLRERTEAGTRPIMRFVLLPPALYPAPLFRVARKPPSDRSTVSTLGDRPRASIRPFVPGFPSRIY